MRLPRSSAALLLPLAAGCAGTPAATSAGTPMPATITGAFITTLGRDTVAVERYVRTATRLEGQLLQRSPRTVVHSYAVDLDPQGAATRLELRTRGAGGEELPGRARQVVVVYRGDSAITTITMPDSTTVQRLAVRMPSPMLTNSVALHELGFARLRRAGVDSATVGLLTVGASQPSPTAIRLVGRDSAQVNYFGTWHRLGLDATGRVTGLDGRATTNKIVARRVDAVDFQALAAASAARDAAGASVSTASPRDTVRATIGGAEVMVDYSRPSRRGRDLWARGVLGDTLWRTGANAATQLRVSRDVTLGGRPLPAGTYTLFTHARDGRYTLHVNRQTGQWGTQYDPRQDVLRVPLAVRTTTEHERFTIALEPAGPQGGQLALRWGTRELAVPMVVR